MEKALIDKDIKLWSQIWE